MGKIETFAILTERQQRIYLAGETVIGTMVIKIKERLKINCVKMMLYGFAKVQWIEYQNHGRVRQMKQYSSYEQYLNVCLKFLTKQDNNDLYLEVGDYSYPFKIQLPTTLPTSFEHLNGRIRYSLNGTIEIPWAFDKHVRKSITVISHVDLNLNPALRQPYRVSQRKVLCCWCCKSDPILATLSILKGGYVPGEPIVFNAIIDNKSSSKMESVSASLVQSVTLHGTFKADSWRARTKSRCSNSTLVEVSAANSVKGHSREEWNNGVIIVPPICASSNNSCRVITINYYLVLHVSPSGASSEFQARIPIVIGTIPLMQENNSSISPPPSYEEYQRSQQEVLNYEGLEMETNGEVTNMDQDWAPSYPYYKDFSRVR